MEAIQTRLSGKELRAYRDAFREFQRAARRLAQVKRQTSYNPVEAERALLSVEHARLTYNDARDVVAASLMSKEAQDRFWSIPASARARERVSSIAELLWELAGKPEGTADDDWYRAERVVQNAAA